MIDNAEKNLDNPSAKPEKKITRRSPYLPQRAASTHEPVVIAQRPMKGGGASLVLRYRVEGKRQTEFLRLYLVPEITKEDRIKNKHTMDKARLIQSERHIQLVRGELSTPRDMAGSPAAELTLFDWLDQVVATKRGSTMRSWKHAVMYVRQFEHDTDRPLSRVDEEWLQRFREFLDVRALAWGIDTRRRDNKHVHLQDSTKNLYLSKICSALSTAYRRGLMRADPTMGVRKFRGETETERVYLTTKELRSLVSTPCDVPVIKEAFLFCCLTGLRWSDVIKIKWDDIDETESGPVLTVRQTKTRAVVRIPLNGQATEILALMRPLSSDPEIFGEFAFNGIAGYHLKVWAAQAGIRKKITWHVSRHTFAMQLLEQGIDIYTIAKLMGHRELKSTQVYAQIRDRQRRDAIDKLPDIL